MPNESTEDSDLSFNDDDDSDQESISTLESNHSRKSKELHRMSSLIETQLNMGFPSTYTVQLIQWSTEVERERERQAMKFTMRQSQWNQWSRRSTILSQSFSSGIRHVVIPLPTAVRNALHETQIFWTAIQLILVIWFMTKVDWQLRLYGPFSEFPNYTPRRMPWLPSQYQMHIRLKVALIMITLIYIPGVIVHFNYVLDDCPDE
ncbi:unnamed protein product [Trichobilharzia regenti]|nr:unnamed protein product [Trichobilharzia regenti]